MRVFGVVWIPQLAHPQCCIPNSWHGHIH
jgi:hypothetical protein